MTPPIHETHRRPAPAERPQALAFGLGRHWVGSLATSRIYALDPATFAVLEEAEAPGKPWGMTVQGDGVVRVLCGETAEDHRVIRRYVPGQGFGPEAIACPEDTGSQLGWWDGQLYVSQWYHRRVLALDPAGQVLRTYELPHGLCGQVAVDGGLYLLGTDDEASTAYVLTRLDLATGTAEDVATVPFQGRGLAHDGERFWSNHREQHQIVGFTLG